MSINNSITIKHNQSLLDIAVQEHGTIVAVIDIAKANNIAVTDDLQPGQILNMPVGNITESNIVNFYKQQSVVPATGLNDDLISNFIEGLNNGIGYWIVEDNFTVQ